MGRKIPGKKHRGVRDILEQNAKKERSLVGKINAPPQDPDDQAVPKTLARIIELKQKVKDGIIPLKRKRKKKSKPALVTSAVNIPKKHKAGRPEKTVPVFQQLPGESGKKFMGRVHFMVQNYLKENEFEQKYQVDIQRNEITGEVEGVVKKPKDEIDELMKKSKKIKKYKKKSSADDEKIKLTKSQKRSEKLKAKKMKKEELNKPVDFEVFKDNIKFGEVVHAPPTFTRLPRKPSAEKIGHDKKKFNDKRLKLVDTTELQSLKAGKRKHLALPVRQMLEKQREIAVNAYKSMRLQKEINSKI